MQKLIKKKELKEFVDKLMKEYEVIASVKERNTHFKIISNFDEVYLKDITLFPVKKFFVPEKEKLFEFKGRKIIENKQDDKKRIIFGLRKCDLNALMILDKVMSDPLYIKKRKNTILVGFYCENPDEYCFCNSMELQDYYDLFFYPYKDEYYISIGSEKGNELVKNMKTAKREIDLKIKNFKKLEDKDIERHYRNKIWENDAEKCLSCAACTEYCPTCNCFDIEDVSNFSLKDGCRIRCSASCQLKSFSKVAGGKVFRESRLVRFKHFVYHKIVYYNKRYGRYMCVGCGRCLRVCPPKIDWVETINLLREEERTRWHTCQKHIK